MCGIIITSMTSEYDGLVCSFTKKLLLYSNITSNVNGSRTQKFHSSFIFLFYFGFLCRYWQLLEQQRKGGVHLYSSLQFALVLKYLSFVCSFVSDVTTFYFSIATHVIVKALIDETYQLLPMIKCQFHLLVNFLSDQIYSNFPQTDKQYIGIRVNYHHITTIQVS